MSIFKVKPWWSNNKLQSNEFSEGLQNGNCLKIDKFNSHIDSDCVIVGEGSLLRIYKPKIDQDTTHTLLETQLNDIVLHIETGKFIAGSVDRQILVLHPQNYEIYQLKVQEGHTDAGDQNMLDLMIKHTFKRKSHSLTIGPFGNIKTRDFICIQSLDGSLSFFDQDTFLFMCLFDDVIIPGPISYIASCDSFVICKSTWVLEIYSYQQLREFSELNIRQNKKNIPQWIYNAGEEISSIQVIQTSSNFSSIIALGERHLYCFQDNGLMKYMIKFDFMPMCFFAYLIGWYYEPGARLLVVVASDDSKLNIYEGTTLLWSCDLMNTAISISRCFLKSLPGGLVTLSTNGIINVNYLGTEPDLNSNATPMMKETMNPEQIQSELNTVEESLQKILENKEGGDNTYHKIDQVIKIKADVGKPVQNLFQQFAHDDNTVLHLLMCPVVIILTCKDPKLIKNIQITYNCNPPLACSDSIICLDNVNGTEIIETQIILSSEAEVPEMSVIIFFTVTDSSEKIVVLSRTVYLPLSLYCSLTEIDTENELKLYIDTNHPCVNFTEVFTDFSKEELLKHGNSENVVTFLYRTTKKTVTVKASDKKYIIETKDFPEMISILIHLIFKLRQHYTRSGVKDFRFKLKIDEDFIKQIIHRFMKSVEIHAKERVKLKSFEESLDVLQRQFTVIQKRLLVQYGSHPPGDCDPLEFLMKDTHKRIITTTKEIIQCREIVCRAGSILITVGNLIIYILRQSTSDTFKVKLVEEMLSLGSLYEDYQEWEETVSQALTYILNNVFKKSEKDKEKLAPVTEQGILSNINLKRFLKQIRMVLDRMFSDLQNENIDKDDLKNKENRVMRIEEFVEVL